MGELNDIVPLAKNVIKDILSDTLAKDTVRSDLATKILVSEGQMKSPKVSDGGRTFVLSLKSDDVVGALEGMRTVFGEPVGEFGEEVKEIGKPKSVEKRKSEKDQLKKAIAAERVK